MNILAIESSCDETAAAVVQDGTIIHSSIVASSSIMHEKYGGIVPEVASREQLRCILPTISEALIQANQTFDSIDAIAVTVGPGLIGSLLIGIEAAKTIAFVTNKPLIPVNHVLAHIYANFLIPNQSIQFPAVALVVSGGHTELFLMKNEKKLKWLGGTIDDAAGEAFDKTARLLGFGSKGGLAIQESAGTASTIRLPRPLLHDHSLQFSFSGLKTAVLREIQQLTKNENLSQKHVSELSYEIQEAITDVLVKKTVSAIKQYNASSILIGGGVAANLRLREKFEATTIPFYSPPIPLCTDNAAYIGSCAYYFGKSKHWNTIEAEPNLTVEV